MDTSYDNWKTQEPRHYEPEEQDDDRDDGFDPDWSARTFVFGSVKQLQAIADEGRVVDVSELLMMAEDVFRVGFRDGQEVREFLAHMLPLAFATIDGLGYDNLTDEDNLAALKTPELYIAWPRVADLKAVA